MDLVGENQEEQSASPNSFVDSEFEQTNLFPWRASENTSTNLNNNGRTTEMPYRFQGQTMTIEGDC